MNMHADTVVLLPVLHKRLRLHNESAGAAESLALKVEVVNLRLAFRVGIGVVPVFRAETRIHPVNADFLVSAREQDMDRVQPDRQPPGHDRAARVKLPDVFHLVRVERRVPENDDVVFRESFHQRGVGLRRAVVDAVFLRLSDEGVHLLRRVHKDCGVRLNSPFNQPIVCAVAGEHIPTVQFVPENVAFVARDGRPATNEQGAPDLESRKPPAQVRGDVVKKKLTRRVQVNLDVGLEQPRHSYDSRRCGQLALHSTAAVAAPLAATMTMPSTFSALAAVASSRTPAEAVVHN